VPDDNIKTTPRGKANRAVRDSHEELGTRTRHLEEERRRERTLELRFLLPGERVGTETQRPSAP
jgi:hypothetical protein